MGFLVAFTRKIQLQNRDNDIQFELCSLNTKLQDLTNGNGNYKTKDV